MSKIFPYYPNSDLTTENIIISSVQNVLNKFYDNRLKNNNTNFSQYILQMISDKSNYLATIVDDIIFNNESQYSNDIFDFEIIQQTLSDESYLYEFSYNINKQLLHSHDFDTLNGFYTILIEFLSDEIYDWRLLRFVYQYFLNYQNQALQLKNEDDIIKKLLYFKIIDEDNYKKQLNNNDLKYLSKITREAKLEKQRLDTITKNLQKAEEKNKNLESNFTIDIMFESLDNNNISKRNFQILKDNTQGKETIFTYLQNIKYDELIDDKKSSNIIEDKTEEFLENFEIMNNDFAYESKIIMTDFQIVFDYEYLARMENIIQKYAEKIIPLKVNEKIYLTFPFENIDFKNINNKCLDNLELIVKISNEVHNQIKNITISSNENSLKHAKKSV